MRRPLLLIAVLAAAAAVGAGAIATGAGPITSPSRRPGPGAIESHYEGNVAWSQKIDGDYHLFVRYRRRTVEVGTPRPTSEDPNFGPGPAGQPTVVYQRCVELVCQLWSYDAVTRHNVHMAWLGHPRRRGNVNGFVDDGQTQPTIWKGRVAFQSIDRTRIVVRLGPSGGPGPVRNLAPGPQGSDQDATAIALGPHQLLMIWADNNCNAGDGCTDVLLDDLAGGAQRTIDQGTYDDLCQSVASNAYFSGSRFAWRKVAGPRDPADDSPTCPHYSRRYSYDPATRHITHTG